MDFLQVHRNQSLAAIAVVSTTLTAYLLLRSNKNKSENTFDEIPIPKKKLPYFGHLFSIDDLLGRTIAKWHKEYGM
ncbi:unnamed protein product [Cunninghamella blakesleeana]